MALRLTATLVKHYFQYRCERQIRYLMLPEEERLGLGIEESPDPDAPWAQAGIDFEQAVVDFVAAKEPVLRPALGQRHLDEVSTAAFLRLERPEEYAHQMRLVLSDQTEFRTRWRLPDGIELAAGYPDLLRVVRDDVRASFQIIDLKLVQVPASFHKAQVAFYSLVLEEMLRSAGLDNEIHPIGQIWHLDPEAGPDEVKWQVEDFRLAGYRAQVADFFQNALGRIATAVVAPTRDDTRFHIYFKCEQCDFLPHCDKAIGDERPVADWDVSAVPGMSHQSKQTLTELGIDTVAKLAAAPDTLGRRSRDGWGLRKMADLLRFRAAGLLEGTVRRLPERFTHLMPPRVDAGLYLSFDQDPVEGRLAAIGCLFRCHGVEEFVTATVTTSGAEGEQTALLTVLVPALKFLSQVDAHNRKDPEHFWIAHVFVYEPAEARDLQSALGRHLNDPAVRRGLLDLVRMFPPVPLLPDPEYGGRRHLPATALRTVFDVLYAVPTKVTHDLRRASLAFVAADPPLRHPYRPDSTFARPFSARLNIDRCRDLKSGQISADSVEADIRARLTALADLTEWVLLDNARAAVPFLRLNKDPFRFQTSFDPLAADDLDLLSAQELLDSRVRELVTLTNLALPVSVRRERFRCLAPLSLVNQQLGRYKTRLVFRGPDDGGNCEIGVGSFGVVLTDGNPDLLLDPGRWPELFVRIVSAVPTVDGLEVSVEASNDTWDAGTLPRLTKSTPPGGYMLDLVHVDENTPRLRNFLRHLARGDAT